MKLSILCAVFLVALAAATPIRLGLNTNMVSIEFDSSAGTYSILLDGVPSFFAPTPQLSNNGKMMDLTPVSSSKATVPIYTGFGKCLPLVVSWAFQGTSAIVMTTDFCVYDRPSDSPTSLGGIVTFTQRFADGLSRTAVGNPDAVCSAFPSLGFNATTAMWGFTHFSGIMAAGETPQFGNWGQEGTNSIAGGMQQTGPLALFAANTTVVISPATRFMAASLAMRGDHSAVDWGVMGNAESIPAAYDITFVLVASRGRITRGMRNWGRALRSFYNAPSSPNERDYTLRYLGYSTDNGAFYYYNTGNYSNYEQALLGVKADAIRNKVPLRYVLIDSWWYYKGDGNGVTNWTAPPSIFPDSQVGLNAKLQWPIQAHNRYWAPDNVYASNPTKPVGPTKYNGKKFPFTWGNTMGLPTTYEFWDYFFSINTNWNLRVYEQDWLSTVTREVPILTQNVTFGEDWLRQMAAAAGEHDLAIQYCMAFPRHLLTGIMMNGVVTQARASDDYAPQSHAESPSNFQNTQWQLGVSGLFLGAIGMAPSKDNFWSGNAPQMQPHYDNRNPSFENRNRLQSVIASLSNGPVQPSDQVGFANPALLRRAARSDGLLLRPDIPVAGVDAYFEGRAGVGSLKGEVYITYNLAGTGADRYPVVYVLSADLQSPYSLSVDDINSQIAEEVDADRIPTSWVAFEDNSTSTFIEVSASSPLKLSMSNVYNFQYFTLVPVYPNREWVLAGDKSKWIRAAPQRYKEISSMGTPKSDVFAAVEGGSPGERVVTTFVNTKTLASIDVTCTFAESLRSMISFVPSMGGGICKPLP